MFIEKDEPSQRKRRRRDMSFTGMYSHAAPTELE